MFLNSINNKKEQIGELYNQHYDHLKLPDIIFSYWNKRWKMQTYLFQLVA